MFYFFIFVQIVPKEEPPKEPDMRNMVKKKTKILGLKVIPLMEVQIVLEVLVVVLKNHQRNLLQDAAGELLEI